MTTDDHQTIREAVSSAGDSLLVLVVPAARVRDLFGEPARNGTAFTEDLTVEEYREQFARKLSDSRIRELCAAKAFPDTTTEDGQVVPGAYKDSAGNWRITREGIVARQRLEREEGLRKRAEAEEVKVALAEAEAEEHRAAAAKQQSGKKPGLRHGASSRVTPAARPNRGTWERHVTNGAGS